MPRVRLIVWRISRPPNRLPSLSRTLRHLHRVPQVPCQLRLLFSYLIELPSPPAGWVTAKLQRSVLCLLAPSAYAGCLRRPSEQVTKFERTLLSFPPFPHTHQDVSDTARIHLLYTRFIAVAGQLAPLFWEFVCRHGARAHPRRVGNSTLRVPCRARARACLSHFLQY
jgi:hypothetical protein